MKVMELYKLTFPNGKAYIGISTKGAKSRFVNHKRAFEKGVNKSILYAAWRKHGEPSMCVLAVFHTVEELRAAEAEAIACLGTFAPDGYNMTPGGEANPMSVPEIAKRAGRPGVKASLETRAKLSALRSGVALSDHHRAAIAKGQCGRVQSSETRQKIAERAKGRQWTAAQRKAASETRKGLPHNYPQDQATKERQANSARQRWERLRSENPEAVQAAIQKQSESLKRAWARRKAAA